MYRMLLKKKAFTLIELLVVIAIIALLVSILLPSLGRAKELAKRTMCSMNLHNYSTAIATYVSNNDGWMPVRHDSWSQNVYFGSSLASEYGTDWVNHGVLIKEEYLPMGMLFCPSMSNGPFEDPWMIKDVTELQTRIDSVDATSACVAKGYWYFQDSPWGSDLYMDDVRKHGVVVADRTPSTATHSDCAWTYQAASVGSYPIMMDYCFGKWNQLYGFYHGTEGLNTLFGSGDARWISDDELYDIIEGDMLNGDGDKGIYGPRNVWFYLDDNY